MRDIVRELMIRTIEQRDWEELRASNLAEFTYEELMGILLAMSAWG